MYLCIDILTKQKKMKNIVTLVAIILIGFSASAQKAMQLVKFSDLTDTTSVLESAIYKTTPQTGDTTTLVEYFYRGQKEKMIIKAEDSLFVETGSRLLTPTKTGLGFGINADKIEGIYKASDTACVIWYNEGNLRKKYTLTVTLEALRTAINAL